MALFFLIVLFCLLPQLSFAVMPPDFVFNVGAQVAQFFSLITLLMSVVFGVFLQFFKSKFDSVGRRVLFVVGLVFILVISGVIAYAYSADKQQKEYQRWLEESRLHSQSAVESENQEEAAVKDDSSPTVPVRGNSNDFYFQNKDLPISITDSEFEKVIASEKGNYVVLDAREDIEYANGHYPDSLHVRFADLRNGRWEDLPKDKYVYVFCWSGIRGKEVAEFLRGKEILAVYLVEGALSWFDYGGNWVGNVKFADKYSASRYHVVFTTEEVRSMTEKGVLLIDTREPERFKESHISGSISIPTMYTNSDDLERTFDQVPTGSKFITVCDGYVNCFNAKITGVELEARGNEFLGRYNKPWEYGK